MRTDRRRFIQIAGLGVLGLGARSAFDQVAGRDRAEAASQTAQPTARQWAMVIDLPKCIEGGDCTDCIAACHAAHNVPDFSDPRQEIKWIWKTSYEGAFREAASPYTNPTLLNGPVTVMCNHCENPACVRVCPTQATFRRADGIVMMDEHRCIGCRYCMVACPYGARSFNYADPREGLDMDRLTSDFPTRTRGVVEKCNFCVERLAKNLPPACMEACKQKAMAFGDLNDPRSAVRQLLATRNSMRRNPGFGTGPQVYYLV